LPLEDFPSARTEQSPPPTAQQAPSDHLTPNLEAPTAPIADDDEVEPEPVATGPILQRPTLSFQEQLAQLDDVLREVASRQGALEPETNPRVARPTETNEEQTDSAPNITGQFDDGPGSARTRRALWTDQGEPLPRDPLTDLHTREALETVLERWRIEPAGKAQSMNLALLDLDGFSHVNGAYGNKTGDRLLRAVADLATGDLGDDAFAARFSGQRFALLFHDVDTRVAADAVERIRQRVEKTSFTHHDRQVRVTLSAAVIQAEAGEAADSLFARGEATLAEAKRYGRNRTFLQEGRLLAPVVPPAFALEGKVIAL
jgi:diguanylate cyclase (GGDEF)-like protein